MIAASHTRRSGTKEEQVADYLREGIISGRYPRGARLKQQEVAELLKTSITPVREALKLLAAEGYVSNDSFRGSVVAPFDIEASTETLNLRIMLETRLVRGAVENANSSDIEELRDLASQFAHAYDKDDKEAARAANYRFHHRMFEIADMPQTLSFVQILWARYPFDLIAGVKGRVSRATDEHEEILEAFISGDTAAAMLATRTHVQSGWEELRAALADESEDPAVTPTRKEPAK